MLSSSALFTSPAERDGSPPSHIPALWLKLASNCNQFNHRTFFTNVNCEECSKSKEKQERNQKNASLHILLGFWWIWAASGGSEQMARKLLVQVKVWSGPHNHPRTGIISKDIPLNRSEVHTSILEQNNNFSSFSGPLQLVKTKVY